MSADELKRLGDALAKHKDRQAADIVRLLLLTGARSGEVRAAKWVEFDLEAGIWTKPASTTKQAKLHRIPLNPPAQELLGKLRKAAADGAEYVFPGRRSAYRTDLADAWTAVCKAADIKDARIHDLRHTYASVLASSGHSLPIIGKLLGHSQAATTQRYAHLQDDPLRKATETAGAIVTAGTKPGAKIVRFSKGGRR